MTAKRRLHGALAGALAAAQLACIGLAAPGAAWAQQAGGLAATPQMGWNSWNKFACNIDEKLIRETADAMVKLGLKDVGYQYINIDDCWHGSRDADGNMRPDPQRFPSGMKALADYVHARGLKLGIYSDVGATTCGGRPGSRGHEYQDARSYAAWGIDYVKYDWCDSKGLNAVGAYTTMRDAIKASGRPMLLSICEWGENKPWEWAQDVGQSWRTTGDIYPCWDCEMNHGSWSALGVLRILDKQAGLRKYAGPGHWNDMDMLEVGMGMTEDEDRAHFSLWAMLNSPLILGNDLRSMPAPVQGIIGRREVIAINQDPLGVQALRFYNQGQVELWAKPLAGDEWAVMILNRGEAPLPYRWDWKQHRISDDLSKREVDFNKDTWRWQDAWTGKRGDTDKRLDVTVPAHGVVLLRLKKA
ncbi:glycoside hydrolase family 27 protein [Massilia forsythiae]|uniref:Alpha-galactosidase n=1 Tax=Massilia forsythiae TaxID=2728020 RepID=A0A7Z2ZS01_9BURK|nr:glycoside hydrolase family 27 protein [Massilia forsythiae]QJD99768.1 glycoside hydrolase family 27 protein [Massilia forsythiae]